MGKVLLKFDNVNNIKVMPNLFSLRPGESKLVTVYFKYIYGFIKSIEQTI